MHELRQARNDHVVVCGEASVPKSYQGSLLHLHLYGSDDSHKVTFEIEDIRKSIFSDVADRLRDLLDIASYVFAADQVSLRGANEVETFGANWRRRFRFVVPVSDVDFWRAPDTKQCLEKTLGFLSDDLYDFEFVPSPKRPSLLGFLKNFSNEGQASGRPEQVIMFSGGLDSLGGAIEEIVNQKRHVLLVNHRSTPKLDKRYAHIGNLLGEKAPYNRPSHIRVTVHKKKWMNREPTQRSRSFLFTALGATISSLIGNSELRFYENGVVSMNLPICAQVVGGRATRTTHPRVLRGFEELLSLVFERKFTVENKFLWKTKAEVVELFRKLECTDLIGPSISCTHTWEMTREHSHCGSCSQCVDRRFAVIAAKAEAYDPLDQYAIDVFTKSRDGAQKVHVDKMLFANYLERANRLNRVTDAVQFMATHPEVVRVLRYLDGDPAATVQRCYDLYKRHASEVNSVVDQMFAVHGRAIRERTLPPDSLVRIVCESNSPGGATTSSVPAPPLPENIFRMNGGGWQVRFKGREPFTALPRLGAGYLHCLLSSPGEPHTAAQIVCQSAIANCNQAIAFRQAVERGELSAASPLLAYIDTVSDWKALSAYRDEADEIRADLERAKQENDNVREAECESKLAAVVREINRSLGIDGKLKQLGDKRKNIRDSFRNAVKRFINTQIKPSDSDLAAHLCEQTRFGNSPRYWPVEGIIWSTEPVRSHGKNL